MAVHQYAAFGIRIRSTFPLPEFVPDAEKGDADVAIREDVGNGDHAIGVEQDEAVVAPQWAHLAFRDVGTCVVREGREIVFSRGPGCDDASLRLALLGPAIAALLQQRGFLLLHASVVRMHAGAIAFLGCSGWGKSTIAAALHLRGHPLIVDDLAAVRLDSGGARVYPGSPQCKLWPSAAVAVGQDWDALPRLHPSFEKRACQLSDGFETGRSFPLIRAFELTVGETIDIEALSKRDALLAILRHSYGIEWLHPVSGVRQFGDRARLASCVPFARLARPYDLSALPAVVDLLERDVSRDSEGRT